MNKDPELNYYALKLAISLKGDDGDTFTKVYDEICKSASLTDQQINWIKDKIRDLQSNQSDALLQTRLDWYEKILAKKKEEKQENTNHQEYERSLTHLRSVMHSIVDNQPSMKSFSPATPSTNLTCAQQSLNSNTTDINKNFDGPHISKPPMMTPKQDFFAGFDNIDNIEMTEIKKSKSFADVDEGVTFPLLGGSEKHQDYSTIKIDSDHGSDDTGYAYMNEGGSGKAWSGDVTESKNRKKKKKKNSSNEGSEMGSGEGPEPMEIDGEVKTKKTRNQRRLEQKKKFEEKKNKSNQLSERGALESGLGTSSSAIVHSNQIYPEKRKKRTIKEFKAEKERTQRTLLNLKGIGGNFVGHNLVLVQNSPPHRYLPNLSNLIGNAQQSQTEYLKQQREQLALEKNKEWKIPQWVEDEERERRKKKLKNKNRKIEENKSVKLKKEKLEETEEERVQEDNKKEETSKERKTPIIGEVVSKTSAEHAHAGDDFGEEWTCFSKKKEKKAKSEATKNDITKSVQSPIKTHLPVQTDPDIKVQDETFWPKLNSDVPKNNAMIIRLPKRTPSPLQFGLKEYVNLPQENQSSSTPADQNIIVEAVNQSEESDSKSELTDEPEPMPMIKPRDPVVETPVVETSINFKTIDLSLTDAPTKQEDTYVQVDSVSDSGPGETVRNLTNNVMGLNFMMDSCDLRDDSSPEMEKINSILVDNLNFVFYEKNEYSENSEEKFANIENLNVTNLEDIEGDQHVIKLDVYPYHTETVKFMESCYKNVLNRLKDGSATNYKA